MNLANETPNMSTGRPVGIAAGIDLRASMPLAGPALIIAGASVSARELRLTSSEAIIARSAEDFRSIKFVEVQYYVVLADGFNLALGLLKSGDLNPTSQIVWSFNLPFLESLSRLRTIGFPDDVAIRGIGGHMDMSVITTASGSTRKVEFESFRAGMDVSAALWGHESLESKSGYPSEIGRELALLRRKHLSVLESLPSAAGGKTTSATRTEHPVVDSSRLENDLILLKRRYDALERKYTALANSRLGAATLRIWDRNKSRRDKAMSAKEGEK